MIQQAKVEARKLKGFRDFLPQQAQARSLIKQAVLDQAKLSGFAQIDTPALEYQDVLLGSSGGETDKEVYCFQDHGEREVALRFDLTVPFARFVSENHNALTFPFKKVQIGEVWRGEKPQKGRYRQFCQADFDIIGADSVASDCEVISCLAQILARVVQRPMTVHLNHRGILTGLIRRYLGEISKDIEQKTLITIDKLAKIGPVKVIELMTKQGIPSDSAERLLAALSQFENLDLPDSDLLQRFTQTVELLQVATQETPVRIKADLSIARGLGYYTGIVFETTIDALPNFGSIASGGRYDNLVARFGKHDLAGVGGSVGVDRLLAGLEELQALSDVEPPPVFVAVQNNIALRFAWQILQQMRQAKIPADMNLNTAKLGKQLERAHKRGHHFVVILGENELQSQTCTLKNLKTGEELQRLPAAETIKVVQEQL